MTTLAHFISNTIHPIILPIVTFWILMQFGFSEPVPDMYLHLLVVVIVCSIVPALVVVVLKKMGKVSDYDISKRENRTLPFLIGVVGYFLGALTLYLLNAPPIIVGFMLCYAINTVLIFFYHISVENQRACYLTWWTDCRNDVCFRIAIAVAVALDAAARMGAGSLESTYANADHRWRHIGIFRHVFGTRLVVWERQFLMAIRREIF